MKYMEKFEQCISEDEISQPRSTGEFICWFEKKRTIIEERRELKKQNLLHEGIAKIFNEELRPLYRLLQNKVEDWRQERFKPIIENQSYDVEVQTDRKDVPKYIEITVANWDEKEHARMECFLEHSPVSMTGEVSIRRDKKTGKKINVENELKSTQDIVQNINERIEKSISKKMTTTKKPDYTALLVYFNDNISIYCDQEALKHKMNTFLDLISVPWYDRYTALYVVDASGKSFYEKQGVQSKIK